jgi:hypothetical protein
MRTHKSITQDRVIEAIESGDYIGFCIDCGEDQEGVDPDAERYECESCGAEAVYGAEQLLLMAM